MSPGYQITQIAHSCADFIVRFPEESKIWNQTSNSIICLSVKDENSLIILKNKLEERGLKHVCFREPDIDNQMTSLAIEPCEASRKLCSNLPLALKKFNNVGVNKNNFKINEQVRETQD